MGWEWGGGEGPLGGWEMDRRGVILGRIVEDDLVVVDDTFGDILDDKWGG